MRTTRNRVYRKLYRGFESPYLRQIKFIRFKLNMHYKVLHFKNSGDMPQDIKTKMVHLVRDVYDDDTAQEFRNEFDKNIPYEYVVVLDETDTNIIGLAFLMNSGLDFDIWEFAWAMVCVNYRGIGVGKLLNDERIKIVKQHQGKKILCVTQKAWHLVRNGFRVVCTFANGDNLMVCEF